MVKKVNNPKLKNALSDWMPAVCTRIGSNIPPDITDAVKIIEPLAEHQIFLAEMLADDRIHAHFSSRIGCDAFQQPLELTPESVVQSLLAFALNTPRIVQNPADFDKFYEFFENSFYSDYIEFRAVAPVSGLVLTVRREDNKDVFDDDLDGFDLMPNLAVRPLKDAEMRLVHNFEIIRRYRFRMSDYVYGICADYGFRKKFLRVTKTALTDVPPAPSQPEFERKMGEINDLLVQALWVLRLFKSGGISSGGTVHSAFNIFAYSGDFIFSSELSDANTMMPPYFFEKDETPVLLKLWNDFRKIAAASSAKHLLIALRRLNYSRTRSDYEDKIIDLMIAAETLARPPHVGDKSAVIADFFAALYPDKSNYVKKIFRQIYGMRNAIVHDGTLEKWLKISGNRNVNVMETVSLAEEFIRYALVRIVAREAGKTSR